jgi:KaiC/GvpD/RAD55 family RecA-like ATPase
VTNGGGKVLITCRAGCETPDVLGALRLAMADTFDAPKERNDRPTIVATYDYVDEDEELLFQVVRFAPKDFRQRRPDGAGRWIWKMADTRRVLYRLPQVLAAVTDGRSIFVVEGEKDVAALESAGEVATCNPGGAGKWRPEHAEALRGAAEVIVVADRDAPGRAHADQVVASLRGLVELVLVVEGLEGKDAADHLAAGHTVDELAVVTPSSAPAEPGAAAGAFFVDWADFWARDRREADWLFEDVLAQGRGHAIYAGFKTGKSLFMLSMAAQLAMRGVAIVYLDYEMGDDDLYDRLSDMGYGPDTDLSHLHYAVLPSLPTLDTDLGALALFEKVDAVQAAHPGAHVAVVIDTTARAVAGEENSADTYRDFYRHTGLGLKQRGVTWARLDHSGKDQSKGQRGSSAKGDDVDVVWHLVRNDNGLELRRDASRMGWVPAKVTFRQMADPLRFIRVAEDWPAGTAEVARVLDGLGVAVSLGERPAGKALRVAGHQAGQHLVRAAQKYRRQREAEGVR